MSRDIQALFNKIQLGDRVALGQVMTLVESDLAEDRKEAVAILELCEQKLALEDQSYRFAISGPPGAG